MKVNYSFGCLKSKPDKRDYLLRDFIVEEKLPPFYDLTPKMTEIRSQGKEGSCTGFAWAVGVKEFQEQREHGKHIELSPRFA